MPFTRKRKASVGQMVEVCHMVNGQEEWLPFMVTNAYEDETTIAGVAFSGRPVAVGWGNRGAQPMDKVEKGDANRHWRFKRGRPSSDEEGD